jgi:hypothetical protein
MHGRSQLNKETLQGWRAHCVEIIFGDNALNTQQLKQSAGNEIIQLNIESGGREINGIPKTGPF